MGSCQRRALRLNEQDNVAVLLEDAQAGDWIEVEGQKVVLREDIPFGHKVALRSIAKGEAILKYGQPIGLATHPIALGEHVHVHNVRGTNR